MSYEEHVNKLLEEIRREREQEPNVRSEPRRFENSKDLLTFLRKLPVIRSIETTTLPSFLRRFREGLNITVEDASNAFGLDAAELVNLESTGFLPWTVLPRTIAPVLSAYRIHIEAITFLTLNSFEIARVSKRISDLDEARQLVSTWLADVRAEFEKETEVDLLA